MGMYNGEKRMIVSSESWRQMFKDNEVEEDRERDGLTLSRCKSFAYVPVDATATWRTCGS